MVTQSDFTNKQKIIIAFRFIKKIMMELFCQHKQFSFASKTRGNVMQRLGGKISKEEHVRYVEEASKKIQHL